MTRFRLYSEGGDKEIDDRVRECAHDESDDREAQTKFPRRVVCSGKGAQSDLVSGNNEHDKEHRSDDSEDECDQVCDKINDTLSVHVAGCKIARADIGHDSGECFGHGKHAGEGKRDSGQRKVTSHIRGYSAAKRPRRAIHFRKFRSSSEINYGLLAYSMSASSSFSWQKIPRPIVALAPMAGVTDASYRRLIKELAPETVVYSEFLSTDAIHYGAKKTMQMMHFHPEAERPFIVQVFGKEPEHFLSAARVVEEMGADGIDINMGCPAARVTSSCHGSALIRKPELAAELVAAAKKAVSIPVSVKTRLGWDTAETLIPFCLKLVEAGADALAIHGRTYQQKYGGTADWEPIYALKEAVPVPVIGNGDITSAQDAAEKIGNLDGVMVGRGTFGNPWLMKDICEAFKEAEKGEEAERPVPTIESISFQEKIPLILHHCELAVQAKGEQRGMLEMRKHLASYVKGFDGARELRAKLVRVETVRDVQKLLEAAF